MKKSVVITLHLVYWVIFYIGINLLRVFPTSILSLEEVGHYLVYLNASIIFWFYLSYFFLFRLLWHIKTALFIIGILICTGVLLYFLHPTLFAYYTLTFSVILPFCATGLLFRFFIDWNKKEKERLQLSRQNLRSELALLRNQINPHFLFNSLHNIDTLISVNPGKASDALLKLSDMMRYVLYDANTDFIELSKETDYLKKYISLQELRISNPELIRLETELQPAPVKIAPMLFIPFIENAIKHTTDKNAKYGISIHIKQTGSSVYFEIVNIFDPGQKINKDQGCGIGLNNVKRRLELIYPKKYELGIEQVNNLFQVKLKIDTHV